MCLMQIINLKQICNSINLDYIKRNASQIQFRTYEAWIMKDDYCLPSAMTAWELKLREAFYQKPSDTSYNSLLIWFTFINKLQLRELLGGWAFEGDNDLL